MTAKEPHPPGSQEFLTKLIISGLLVLAGGVFAGYAVQFCASPVSE
jgi:hypothetical protein